MRKSRQNHSACFSSKETQKRRKRFWSSQDLQEASNSKMNLRSVMRKSKKIFLISISLPLEIQKKRMNRDLKLKNPHLFSISSLRLNQSILLQIRKTLKTCHQTHHQKRSSLQNLTSISNQSKLQRHLTYKTKKVVKSPQSSKSLRHKLRNAQPPPSFSKSTSCTLKMGNHRETMEWSPLSSPKARNTTRWSTDPSPAQSTTTLWSCPNYRKSKKLPKKTIKTQWPKSKCLLSKREARSMSRIFAQSNS